MNMEDIDFSDGFQGMFCFVSRCRNIGSPYKCIIGDHPDMEPFEVEQLPGSLIALQTLTRSALQQHSLYSSNHFTSLDDEDTESPSESRDEDDINIATSINNTSLGRTFESGSETDDEEILSAEQLLGEDFECEAANNGMCLLWMLLSSHI